MEVTTEAIEGHWNVNKAVYALGAWLLKSVSQWIYFYEIYTYICIFVIIDIDTEKNVEVILHKILCRCTIYIRQKISFIAFIIASDDLPT